MPSGAGASAPPARGRRGQQREQDPDRRRFRHVVHVGGERAATAGGRKRLNRAERHATKPACLIPIRRELLQGAAAVAGGLLLPSCAHTSSGPALPAAARAAGGPDGQGHALHQGRQAVLHQRHQLLGGADAGARRQPGGLGSGAARSRRDPGRGHQHDPDLRRDRRARTASRSGSCRRSSPRWASTIRRASAA